MIRAMHPDATAVRCVAGQRAWTMRKVSHSGEDGNSHGIFEARIPDISIPFRYRLHFTFADGNSWECDDPYRFLPSIGEIDQHLFNEGTHLRLWDVMGARVRTLDDVSGVSFAVWAPNASRVSVVGDFCQWDGRRYPMRVLGSSGIFELFIPGLGDGTLYKFEIQAPGTHSTVASSRSKSVVFLKSDPYARKMEQSPGTAAIVVADSKYEWSDSNWLAERARKDFNREPLLVYEVHLGSWARVPEDGNRPLTYREIAPRLVSHARSLGVTHIELMPIAEHPFTGSWGYQVTGFYAPTSRYGTADDLRFLVDECHREGLGIILDWVPAHFPKDDHALRRFDGSALYEHEDPRVGDHPDWGTHIFNLARNEVRGFLTSNALYWLREFHFDGLRVDAVASMLYLDYSREEGEWLSNRYGGRENLEAIEFLRTVNSVVKREVTGALMMAEESTAWPGVTGNVEHGGLGFSFKWNLGWMHDTLSYFSHEPVHRSHHQDLITFAMLYEYTEKFIMPLSHDEVVHEKRSLLSKMPGDDWQKFANLRALLGYMYTRPSKKLIFMGTELAPWREWDHDSSLDWHLLDKREHAVFFAYMQRLGELYRETPSLWQRDFEHGGFAWIDVNDRDNSVFSYVRWDHHDPTVVVLNLTPVPRTDYVLGAPRRGNYSVVLNSDDARFGGSGHPIAESLSTQDRPFHSFSHSLRLALPPLSILVLRCNSGEGRNSGQ